MDTFAVIIIIAFVCNLIIGSVVILADHHQRLNQLFFAFSFSISIWVLSNFLSGYTHNLFWLESTYSLGCWATTIGLIWFINLCEIKLSKNIIILMLFFGGVFFYLPFINNLIVTNVTNISFQGWDGNVGPGFLFFAIYVVFNLGTIFYVLFTRYKKIDGVKKIQLQFVFVGATIWLVIISIVTFFLPLGGILIFTPLDSPSSLIFVLLTGIAIARHHLFSIKVIATELLVFSLWFILLLRSLISDNYTDVIVNSSLLLITIVIGIFLILSVIKEVSLREHIEKLATDLQKANDRLTELDRQKSEFVSFATHQLRAPLTAMKGYASLILDGDMGAVSDEVKTAISRIFDSTNTLTSIVNDYLNITRIELGAMKYAFDTVDLRSLVSDVIGELGPNIKNKKEITFTFEPDPAVTDWRVTADRDKLKQVIANLIDNSIKYTPQGWVKATLTRDPVGPRIVFTVKDNGIGIAPEVIPHLFAKFSRAPGANKVNIKGTGLGLFVAKEIITAHHANIHAESPGEGKGSAFIVDFEPFAKA